MYEFPAYVTVYADSETEARKRLEDGLAELANTIVNGDLGLDIVCEGEPTDVTDEVTT